MDWQLSEGRWAGRLVKKVTGLMTKILTDTDNSVVMTGGGGGKWVGEGEEGRGAKW